MYRVRKLSPVQIKYLQIGPQTNQDKYLQDKLIRSIQNQRQKYNGQSLSPENPKRKEYLSNFNRYSNFKLEVPARSFGALLNQNFGSNSAFHQRQKIGKLIQHLEGPKGIQSNLKQRSLRKQAQKLRKKGFSSEQAFLKTKFQPQKFTNQQNKAIQANLQQQQIHQQLIKEISKNEQQQNFRLQNITDIIDSIIQKSEKWRTEGNFDNQLCKFLQTQLKKYYFDSSSTNEILQIIHDMVYFYLSQSKSHNAQRKQQTQQYKLGLRLSKLLRSLNLKQEQFMNNLNIMAQNIISENYRRTFFHFKFDFSIQSTVTPDNKDKLLHFSFQKNQLLYIAEKTYLFCQFNYNAIAFLSLYFCRAVQKIYKQQNSQKSIKHIEQTLSEKLTLLGSKVYPQIKINDNDNDKKDYEEIKKFKKQNQTLQKVELNSKNQNQLSKLQLLEKFIIKKSQIAKPQHQIFVKLVQKTCRKRGHGFLSGVKIKSQHQKSAIWRTIEKMIEDEKLLGKFKELKQIYRQKYNDYNKSFIKLQDFIQEQQREVKDIIQKVINEEDFVYFNIKDMVRGKCVYEKAQQLIETVKDLKQEIRIYNQKIEQEQNDYLSAKQYQSNKTIKPNQFRKIQIIELKNELQKKSMVKIFIQLPNVIAQLQLVLKLDKISNQFNHKLYQLKRSQLYSLTTNLFLHNQKWEKTFFTDFNHTIDFIVNNKIQIKNMHKSGDYEGLMNYKNAFYDKILRKNVQQNYNKNQENRQSIKKYNENISKILQSHSKSQQKSKRRQILSLLRIYWGGYYYEQALAAFQEENVQQIQQKQEKLIYAQILISLGKIKNTQRKYDQALIDFQKALQIRTNILGQNHKDVAGAFYQIGGAYCDLGKYDQALTYQQKALQLKISLLGQNNQEVANSLNSIANVYCKKQKYDQALIFYQKALQLIKNLKGQNCLDISNFLNNMGFVYLRKQKFDQSLTCFKKSLQIRISLVGQNRTEVASTYDHLCSVYIHIQDFRKSLQAATKSYLIFKNILPQNHPTLDQLQTRVQKLTYAVQMFSTLSK